jgi:hypothetical protein
VFAAEVGAMSIGTDMDGAAVAELCDRLSHSPAR